MTTDGGVQTAEYIVFGRPHIGQPEIDEVCDSLRSGWLGTGPKVKAFEEAFRTYVGGRHAVAANSCTAALHLSLAAMGVGPDDEVILPTLTFCATANVVVHTGARPVLVDVDPVSQCIDVAALEAAITPRTKAVMPVHFAGWPAPMVEIRRVADAHGLRIVQDAAHCVEGRIGGKSLVTFGDVCCYSFYPTKNVVTGEGGMIVADDETLARQSRVLGLHGLDADAWKRFSRDGFKHYECVVPGFKYNMIDLQAALGLHQLARVEDNLVIRERQWRRYQGDLADLPLGLPGETPVDVRHARHLYTIRVLDDSPLNRDTLIEQLHHHGVGTGVHYRPVHEHHYYRELLGVERGAFPVAADIGSRTVSLPLGPGLTDDDQSRVIDTLHRLLRS